MLDLIKANEILSELKNDISAISISITDRSRKDGERYICFVETKVGKSHVIKLYQNCYNTIEQVSAWHELAKLYKEKGVNVALFEKFKNNKHAIKKVIDNKKFIVWVEEYIEDFVESEEEKIANMNHEFYTELGKTLGIMHSSSKDHNLKFKWNSPWVLFDTFSSEDTYDENYENVLTLYKKLKDYPIDLKRLDRIWEKYISKRELVKDNYDTLACGAVQGDLSINNLIMDASYKFNGIYDFNIAGNDVYVNHMMQEGVFLSYMSDNFWNTKEELDIMDEKFFNYLDAYKENYILSDLEKEKMNTLYQIIRPFRMEKVYKTIAFASKAVKVSNETIIEINKRLSWMEEEMDRDFIKS